MKTITCFALPDIPAPHTIYRLVPTTQPKGFYEERTDRNIGWITRKEQKLIQNSVVAIAGCGGMGGLVAATLLRLGVGEIRIADTEVFDVSNLNRQFAATKNTLGVSKAFATAKMLRAISDDTTIVVYPQGIVEETVEDFVKGADIICDEIEFWAIASRTLLHQTMRTHGTMILNSSTVGHRVYVFKFTPDSMTVEDVLGINYEEAVILQDKIQKKQASPEEIRRVMDMMLRLAAPEIPEYSAEPKKYSTVAELTKRLLSETRASIIATNPPMASGFLANQVVIHLLLEKSGIQRNFIILPPMPEYAMFDAGFLTCSIQKGMWPHGEPVRTIEHAIKISVVTDSKEHAEAAAFVRRKYKEHYNTIPKDASTYIVAKRNSIIVGTMGFDPPTGKGMLSIPANYTFDISKINLPVTDANAGQCNRWTSEEQDISLVLVYAVAKYAKNQALQYLWVEQAAATNKILHKAGVYLVPLEDARIVLEKVEEGDRAFYENKNPLLYILDVDQAISALHNPVSLKLKEKKLVFEEEFGMEHR